MNIQFKIGDIKDEGESSIPALANVIKELKNIMHNMPYSGTLTLKNSQQLNINFDDALFKKLSEHKWSIEKKPKCDLGNSEADLIISRSHGIKTVIEIEKGNKKTIWFDFIKMWIFIGSKKADFGVLICPLNYAHKHGVWHLFDEALNYKKYLGRFAGVTVERLNSIGIIGYQQLIKNGSSYILWDKEEFNRIKTSHNERVE